MKRAKTNPFELDYQSETAARLRAAVKWSQKTLAVLPPARDLHRGTSLANAWALITVAYSGVEQSLKFLISQQKHKTVREWRCSEEGEKLGSSHGLIKLFDALDPNAVHVVTEYYERFQSLHRYITKRSLRGFLEEVSRGEKGYILWRYSLVDEDPKGLPMNSPHGMMALWCGLVELIEHRQGRARPVVMPDENLWDMLRSYDPCLRNRMEQADHPLNACAEMLWEQFRGIAQSEEVAQSLTQWVQQIADRADGNLLHLVLRARGLTETGAGIRWNKARNRFEDVPWTLPLIEVDDKPQDAESIDVSDQLGARQAVLRIVHSSGFSVKERMLNRSKGEKAIRRGREAKWQCTLQAEKATMSSAETVEVRIWENILDPTMHVTLSGESEMSMARINWEVIEWLTSKDESGL